MNVLHLRLLPGFNFCQQRRIGRQTERDRERQNENQIVEQEIAEAAEVVGLVVEQTNYHQVRPAHTRELTETDEETKGKGGRRRDGVNQPTDGPVGEVGDFEFEREAGEEGAEQIQETEKNEERRAELAHKVRHIKNVE